jgi:tricorn protease interacting factor F2/3
MAEGVEPIVSEYRLLLDLDFEGLRWTGTVEFDVTEGASRLALDCEGLEVAAVRVGGRPVGFSHDPSTNRLSFELGRGHGPEVAIDFSGRVETKNLFGLYRSRHGSGYLVTSHCEPTGARRIFPCVDRPDRKARIVLTVRGPSEVEVIGNAPVLSKRQVDGRREWRFEPTPAMSTYLFYLGVGRFDFRESAEGSKVVVRVATPPGRGDAGAWALRSAARILRAYEEYYGIPYPLPKLDLIAVTEHAFGAMENWGAISFQETRLLVDAASGTFATRDVFTTAGHEIAHQWFGNLVTMSSWDDIWLNESFASLMETKITEALEPSFEPWNDFFLRVMGEAEALDGDSLRATHPVRGHVDRPDEMSQIFDEISYGKGSSVLAMFDRYLGEEKFRAGVTDYLGRFRFRNACTEDLLAALERASGEPVPALAGPWIDRAGLPVITARSDPAGVGLSQRRFSYLGSTDEEPWPIPMVVDVDGRLARILFDRKERRLDAPPGSTVLLNPGSIGFYRVLYDRPLLDRLLVVLPKRSGRDAFAVVNDLAAFVRSGDADWATYARAAEAFGESTDRLIVETFAKDLSSFALQFPHAKGVERTARGFLSRQVARVGVDRRAGEPTGSGIVRDRIAFARVRIDPGFAEEISPRFDSWDRLDPDLRLAVAIARVRAGEERGFEAVRKALERPGSDVEADRLERALVWSSEPARVREILDLASAGGINRGHVFRVALQAASNPAGRAVTWAWVQQNLDGLTEIFRGSGYLPLLLEHTIPLVGLGRAAEVRRFFERRATPEGTRGLAKGLERLDIVERLGPRLS